MATGGSATAANSMLGTLTGTYVWVQLHTASPGAAGTTSIASNSTRKQITSFAAASGGSIATSMDLVWSAVGATEVYSHFTVWTASTAGTFGFSGTLTGGSVVSGNDFKILSGQLTASFTLAS